MPGTERRLSSSSEDASVPLARQDGTELIPTRTIKTTASKPAANPLQFIKVGPCDLYKAAQEQIKKVEEIKKVEKTVKEESEDWQSNLDNWKCSRRKRQEHIIDRVVEVKKLELEEHERNRRRGKTLTEMMEERTQKGIGPRKSSLLVYPADDPDDLTDLGISTPANTNDNDSGFVPDNSDNDSQNTNTDANDNKTEYSNKNGTNGHGNTTPEAEEYTYERAIQGYKSYAEKNVKAKRVSPPKKETGARIGEKLNELEQVRLRSNSVTDVNLPKVDIHKRRSLFEVVVSADSMSPSAERVARDLGGAKIVRERLSSLERNAEPTVKSSNRPQEEVVVTIKDRLSSLEKQKIDTTSPSRGVTEEEIPHVLSIKKRLSSLEKHQQGLKDSTNCGSSSDEDFGQKLLLSPAMSDREVSSPLVSVGGVAVGVTDSETNTVVDGRETNIETVVEGCSEGHDSEIGEIPSELIDDVATRVTVPVDETEVGISTETVEIAAEEIIGVAPQVTVPVDEKEIGISTETVEVVAEVVAKGTKEGDGDCSIDEIDCNNVPKINVENVEIGKAEAIASVHSNQEVMLTEFNNVPKEGEIEIERRDGPLNSTIINEDLQTDNNVPIMKGNSKDLEATLSASNSKEEITTVTEVSEFVVDEAETLTTLEKTTVVSDNSGPIIIENTITETIMEDDEVAKTPSKLPTPSRLPTKVSKTRRSGIKKPQIRVRKLTPIITAPPRQVLSPVKSPGDLDVLFEDGPLPEVVKGDLSAIVEDDFEAPVAAPRHIVKASSSVKGAETSESGIDMEESSLYTDENIDEVLAEDDDVDESECPPMAADEETLINFEDDIEDDTRMDEARRPKETQLDRDRIRFDDDHRHHDSVTRFDEFINDKLVPETNVLKIENSPKKEVDVIRIDSNLQKEVNNKVDDAVSFEESTMPLSEVSFVSSAVISEKVPLVTSSTDVGQKIGSMPPVLYENIIIANEVPHIGEIVTFPLSPTSCAEPPKEKPPPPPVDLSDEDAPELPPKKTSLRRVDSTKRIKKEIRKKRSDFLGIEGSNDDSYLDREVDCAPPPDMMTLLQEERRLDQQLYRQSFASETDSTEGTDRISAVDRLDKSIFLDQSLYRQSICSETDSNHETAESRDSGVELDRGHADDLCWPKQSVSPDELSNPHSRQNSEPYGNASVTSEEDEIMKKEREIIEELEKEEKWRYGNTLTTAQHTDIGEKLTVKLRELEKEKLQLEWERAEEEGRRMADEERLQAKEVHLRQQENTANINNNATHSQENLRSERERLEREQLELARAQQVLMAQKRRSEPPRQGPMSTNLRYSMPDLQQSDGRAAPPANSSPSTWTRVPSADNLLAPQQQQQMSRTTLQALAAAPRSRIVAGEAWMQPKRKQDAPKSSYNYQHWLIQEAEHRRITEQQQRVNQSRRSLPNQPIKRSPTHSTQTSPLRPHSGQFSHFSPPPGPTPYSPPSGAPYPVPAAAPYSPPSSAPYPAPAAAPYSPPKPSHTRAVSNPTQSPPHLVNHSHSHSVGHPHHTVGLPPSPHVPHPHSKPLPDSVIQTLTQRVQNKVTSPRRRVDERPPPGKQPPQFDPAQYNGDHERMLSVSGKKKCSHCTEELGRGAAMVIESLRLFYHIDCFKCCVCHSQLGDGLMGTDVRVRNNKLHCHNCYSSDDGVKFSCV